jgi:translation initiation factor 1
MKSRNVKKSTASNSRRVYSTDIGRTCPGCLRAPADCVCRTGHNSGNDGGTGPVHLHRESKGRKGKGVVLVKGLLLSEPELAAVAKLLKSSCGVGGSVKAGVIELQTADRNKIKMLLEGLGHTVKIAGG